MPFVRFKVGWKELSQSTGVVFMDRITVFLEYNTCFPFQFARQSNELTSTSNLEIGRSWHIVFEQPIGQHSQHGYGALCGKLLRLAPACMEALSTSSTLTFTAEACSGANVDSTAAMAVAAIPLCSQSISRVSVQTCATPSCRTHTHCNMKALVLFLLL